MNNKLTKESLLLTRNYNILIKKKTIFYGNIKDNFPTLLPIKNTLVYTTKYNIWKLLQPNLKKNVFFHWKIKKQDFINSNVLIYYWPKDKKEAVFQLQYLLSCNIINYQLIIVGENNYGVRSSENILKKLGININKIDVAKRCTLFLGIIKKINPFNIKSFYNKYIINDIIIKILPGVFGYLGFDLGTLLIASTFNKFCTGKILDIGCGTGILSILLHQKSTEIDLTLIDIDFNALESSKNNLKKNNIKGKILASNLFSNICNKFDLIISNPPIHEGTKFTVEIIKKIIIESVKYLNPNGELRFVTQSSLSFLNVLNKNFNNAAILKQNKFFKVYQAFV